MITDILNPAEAKRYRQAVMVWKQELKELERKHLFYSKYHKDFFIQQTLFLTEEQMVQTMIDCIKHIESLTADLAFWEAKLYNNELARFTLRQSNKPFDGINLKEHTLTQQTLF